VPHGAQQSRTSNRQVVVLQYRASTHHVIVSQATPHTPAHVICAPRHLKCNLHNAAAAAAAAIVAKLTEVAAAAAVSKICSYACMHIACTLYTKHMHTLGRANAAL
jgi:hypothetical protein